MEIIDVTDKIDFENNDDESLPITKCVCGEDFLPWEFYISIYEEDAYSCPKCNRRFFFENSIKVYEIKDGE